MRWNGWGNPQTNFDLPSGGLSFIEQQIGTGNILGDASLEFALNQIPPSRITLKHPLINITNQQRLIHARGQSLPDWLAKKSGLLERYPDAVSLPERSDDVQTILALAAAHDWMVIPFGGGTSVVGHINTPQSTRPVIVLSLARLNQLLSLDEVSHTATFGAGVAGPDLEAQLKAHGYTLGHFPQSFEYSTLGGWVATRSSGQQSLRYGRIEQLFAGGKVETPQGTLQLPAIPASAAASDFRQHILGSEGRLGIITEVEVKISAIPQCESFGLAFFKDWQTGSACIRKLTQHRCGFSMLRLSNPKETQTQLLLSVEPNKRRWLERALRWFKIGDQPCMLLYGITGDKAQSKLLTTQLKRQIKVHNGLFAGKKLAGHWAKNRFRSPYLRETLWQQGYVVDTLETCVSWANLDQMLNKIETSLNQTAAKFDEKIVVFSHLSHCYHDGATIYTSYIFRPGDSYQQALNRWEQFKHAASTVIVENQGTISHQHGVGRDHAPYLVQEKGELTMAALKAEFAILDPDQRLNSGVICD